MKPFLPWLAGMILAAGWLVTPVSGQEAPPETPEAAQETAAEPGEEAPADESVSAEAYSASGADTCIKCHDSAEILSIFKTKHGSRAAEASPFAAGQLQCEACHGPGGAHAARLRSGQPRPAILSFGAGAATPAASQNRMCLGCHEGKLQHAWRDGTHDRNDVACADCHRTHAAHDEVRSTRQQAERCFGCHQEQRIDHSRAFRHPIEGNLMSCSSCHAPHGSTAEFDLRRNSVNETCYGCHAEKRGPFLWEHAPVAEDCSNCHAPHGASQPALLKARAPLLCQQCHSQAGHPSFVYGPNNLPGGPQPSSYLAAGSCLNCHSQVHGSNHPSGSKLTR